MYDANSLQMVLYQLQTRPDEVEVVLGINGATERPGWEKKNPTYRFSGGVQDYMDKLFGKGSPIVPLIKKPNRNDDRLHVGTDLRRGIQFTIPASDLEEFIRLIESLPSSHEN